LLETRVGGASVTAARVPAETVIARGDQVRLSAQAGRLHFFDPETELPISA
jgi:multiple sugar transport system ATP-binding protein